MHRCLLITNVLIHLWLSGVAAQCTSGKFGADCSGDCHCQLGHKFCDLNDGHCTQGPCKPGWTNLPLCQTECPTGFFGLNCTYDCHCNTVDNCSAINGRCSSNECASGWIGPSCQTRLPVLSKPPEVKSINIHHSEVTLAWSAYEPIADNISISSYEVEKLSEAEPNWTHVDSIDSVSSDTENYSLIIPDLERNQSYKFRIIIVWLSSNKPQTSDPGPETGWVHIPPCQEPTDSTRRLDVKLIDKRTDKLRISWLSPLDKDSGCNRYDTLMINLTCSPKCQPTSSEIDLPSSSTILSVSQRNRSRPTLVTVRVQAFNDAGLGSKKISTFSARLLPNAQYDPVDNRSGSNEIKQETSSVGAIEDSSTVAAIEDTNPVTAIEETSTVEAIEDASPVKAIEDTSTVATIENASIVAAIEDTSTASQDFVSTISEDASTSSTDANTSKYVTKDSVVATSKYVNKDSVVATSKYVNKDSDVATNFETTAAIITQHDQNETGADAASGALDLAADALTGAGSSLANNADNLFSVISAPYSQSTLIHKRQKRFQLLKRSQHMMSFREMSSEQYSNDTADALEIRVREFDSLYAVVSEDPPQTTIDSSGSIVISNLKAGTLYQVDVYSKSLKLSETVLVFSVSYWTLMQTPPKLSPPEIVDIGNTSITLKANLPRLVKRANVGVPYGIMVVVEPDMNIGSRFKALTESLEVIVHDAVAVSFKESPLQGFRSKGAAPYYVTLEVVDGPPQDGVIVVGDDKIYGKQGEYHNVPLMPDTRYWLWIGLTSSLDGVIQLGLTPLDYPVRTVGAMPPEPMRATRDDTRDDEGGLDAGSVAAIVLAVILIFLILCLLGIWWYKCHEIKDDPPPPVMTPEPTVRPNTELTDKNLDKVFAEEKPVVPALPEKLASEDAQTERRKPTQNTFDASFYVMKANHPIPVAKLRHHYETHLRPNSHYALQDEFRRLPDGVTDIANVASLPYNVSLNRSQAIVPYDKNRVKLGRQYPNDSTYINASYIRTIGYRSCIVTQCPMTSTANEFWRMIWEMQVGTIVMLIASREANGSEYYHYWPKKSKPTHYRDVKVQLMREDKLAHHEVREFRLSSTSEKVEVRRVIQWQYVQWRPGGIPDHPIPFLNMVAAIQEEHDPESGFVIHCLKGGGRSGIYAAVDALVNEGKQSGKVDVLECVTLLRLERVNLVKSLKQYRFLYHCLIEAFNCHETRTPVHRFHFMLANLLARNELDLLTRFEKEYSAVQLECHAVRPYVLATSFRTRCSSAGTRFSSPDQRELEGTEGAGRINDGARSYGVLPSDQLSLPATIPLDGCYTKDAFILSSPPDKTHLDRFWEMINENNASCIVMLNKAEDMPFAENFLPDDGSCVNFGRYTIYCDSVLIHPNSSFYVHNLNIVLNNNCNNAYAANSLRLYEFAKWPNSLEVPLIDAVLDLTINVADWNQRVGGGRPAVVFSIHGGDKARAALFSIIWMMIDPIQYDGVIDVYSAARYVYSYMPIAITSVEQYHFLYRVMEEHVIRIETQKWRPEKVSESYSPSVSFKTQASDGIGEEGLHSQSLRKPGRSRKRLKRFSSDGSAIQSLRKKKRGGKCVRVDEDVSAGDSTSDGDQDAVGEKSKPDAGADGKGVSPAAEESNERWLSPDKTGKWAYPEVNKETSADAPEKKPRCALIDESNRRLPVPEATPKAEKKVEATSSPEKKVADDRKYCLPKQRLPSETQKEEKPEVKPVMPKFAKYEPSEVIQFCSRDRRLGDQAEVTQPSLTGPIAKKPAEPTSAPVDNGERSAEVAQRKPSLTGTSSDELPATFKKMPVTSSVSRMRCKCQMTPGSKGSPRRVRCRCKMKCDSAHSDDSDKQRPAFEPGAINTATRPATAESRARSRKDMTELSNSGGSLKKISNLCSRSSSDEDRYKCYNKPLTKAEKERKGLSLGRGKPGFQFRGASSSDEDNAARQGRSPKRPGLKQSGITSKKSSSRERRVQRKSPSRIRKYSPKFDERECRPVSPNKKPSGACKDVISRNRYPDEINCNRYPSRKAGDVTEAQATENNTYSREARGRAPDHLQGNSYQNCLKKSGKSSVEERNFQNLSSTEKKSPAVHTSSQSDDIGNFSLSVAPKLKVEKKCATRAPAENERDRRRYSPGRSSSQEFMFARNPWLRDGNTKGPPGRYATDSRAESETLSLKERPQSVSPTRQAQMPLTQRRNPPAALSKEGEICLPKSKFTSEKRGRISPVNSPKRPLSPARYRRSSPRAAASPKRSRRSSRSSSRDRSCGGEKPIETSSHREESGITVPRPASRNNQRLACQSFGKSRETNDNDQKNPSKMPPGKDGTTLLADVTSSLETNYRVLNTWQSSFTKPDRTGINEEVKPPPKQEISQHPKHVHQIVRAYPSNVGCEIKQQIADADYTPSITKTDYKGMNTGQSSFTKPDRTGINVDDKPPPKHETSQQHPKHVHQIARAYPSNVGCEIKQETADADYTPRITRSTARREELKSVKDEAKLNSSLSDLSIDTRLTLERAQAQVAQKDSKTKDLKPEEKLQSPSNESKDVKVPKMYGNQKPPLSTSPATKEATASPTKEATASPTKEATAPCSKLSAKAPVEDASFDDLLDGLYYMSSVVSGKAGPSNKARQPYQVGIAEPYHTGILPGPSKAADSSLSPERNTGINNASPKLDTSPKPEVSPASCSCSASPAVAKGFHPKDIDIPYIDDA